MVVEVVGKEKREVKEIKVVEVVGRDKREVSEWGFKVSGKEKKGG